MSLAEIMPAVRSLPREEKMELVRVLSAELAASGSSNDDPESEALLRLIPPGATFHIYTPEFSPGAADVLAELLKTQKAAD
jgi:hypothetical protein